MDEIFWETGRTPDEIMAKPYYIRKFCLNSAERRLILKAKQREAAANEKQNIQMILPGR